MHTKGLKHICTRSRRNIVLRHAVLHITFYKLTKQREHSMRIPSLGSSEKISRPKQVVHCNCVRNTSG